MLPWHHWGWSWHPHSCPLWPPDRPWIRRADEVCQRGWRHGRFRGWGPVCLDLSGYSRRWRRIFWHGILIWNAPESLQMALRGYWCPTITSSAPWSSDTYHQFFLSGEEGPSKASQNPWRSAIGRGRTWRWGRDAPRGRVTPLLCSIVIHSSDCTANSSSSSSVNINHFQKVEWTVELQYCTYTGNSTLFTVLFVYWTEY